MTRTLQRSVAALMFGAAILATPGIALASCALPAPLDQAISEAETVFVGTVVGLDFDARWATFEVLEVWKGAIGAEAVVNGGPGLQELGQGRAQGENIFSSVDRQYGAGETYLVVSYGRSGEILLDNACSSTQLMSAEAEVARPATAFTPTAAPELPETPEVEGGSGWITPTIVSALALAATAGGIYLRRRPNPDIW